MNLSLVRISKPYNTLLGWSKYNKFKLDRYNTCTCAWIGFTFHLVAIMLPKPKALSSLCNNDSVISYNFQALQYIARLFQILQIQVRRINTYICLNLFIYIQLATRIRDSAWKPSLCNSVYVLSSVFFQQFVFSQSIHTENYYNCITRRRSLSSHTPCIQTLKLSYTQTILQLT